MESARRADWVELAMNGFLTHPRMEEPVTADRRSGVQNGQDRRGFNRAYSGKHVGAAGMHPYSL